MNHWNWIWRWLLGIFIFGAVIVWIIGVGVRVAGIDDANAAQQAQVCDALDSGKINTTGDPLTVTITAPAGHLIDGYCVKAGSANSGDGPVHVTVNPPQATVTIEYPGGKAVSHYSYSFIGVEEPTTTTTSTTSTSSTTTTAPRESTTTTAISDTTTTAPPDTTTTEPPPVGGVPAGGGAMQELVNDDPVEGRPLAEWFFIVIGVTGLFILVGAALASFAFDRGWLVRPGIWR